MSRGLFQQSSLFYRITPIVLIIITGAACYAEAFHVPFIFDDLRNIVDNPTLRDLSNFSWPHFGVSGPRVLGYLTFALNYHWGGLAVESFHLVNVVVHIVCALALYGFMRMSISSDEDGAKGGVVASFTAAIIFVAHPVQTQAVTYLVQRFASLASCLFLVSLFCYAKARQRMNGQTAISGWAIWYLIAIVSCVAAMVTKEIAFTLPLMIVLYEALFQKGGVRKKIMFVMLFVMTLAIIPVQIMRTSNQASDLLGTLEGVSRSDPMLRSDYFFTQLRVIMTYIRLLILPVNQQLDYDYPLYTEFWTPPVLASFAAIILLMFFGLWLLRRAVSTGSRYCLVSAFGIMWFFTTLSIESSIIPINDVIFEHRLYLPSIGFFMAVGSGVGWFYEKMVPRNNTRLVTGFLVVIVAFLSAATSYRNFLWSKPERLLEDNVAKAPRKSRVRVTLALRYIQLGRYLDAERELETALKLNVADADVYQNLGYLKLVQGKVSEGKDMVQIAVSIRPVFPEAWLNLGIADFKLGLFDEAVVAYRMSITQDSSQAEAFSGLGFTLLKQGKSYEAAGLFEAALRMKPELREVSDQLSLLKRQK